MLKSGLRKDQKGQAAVEALARPDDYGVGNLRWP